MFRSMDLRTLVGVGFAMLGTGGTFSAVALESIPTATGALWLAACVPAFVMVTLWRPEVPVTLAANLSGRRQLRRRRRGNKLIRALIQRA